MVVELFVRRAFGIRSIEKLLMIAVLIASRPHSPNMEIPPNESIKHQLRTVHYAKEEEEEEAREKMINRQSPFDWFDSDHFVGAWCGPRWGCFFLSFRTLSARKNNRVICYVEEERFNGVKCLVYYNSRAMQEEKKTAHKESFVGITCGASASRKWEKISTRYI